MTTVKSLVFLNVLIYIGFVFTFVYIVYFSMFIKKVATNFEVESPEEWKTATTTVSSQLGIKKSKVSQTVKTFGELNTWLCHKERKRPKNSLKIKQKVHRCPDNGKGIVTVFPGGRTGEFHYFT